MAITLRENQREPIEKAIEFFRKNKTVPSIIVLPTAWGKSILTAFVADAIKDKLLVLQPTKELLEQNYKKFVSMGGYGAIYSASFNSRQIGKITYATIGSIKSIGATFKELGIKYLLIDEAHLYPREADSMLGKFLKDADISHTLGITATPLKLQTNRDLSGESFSKLVMLTSRSKKGNFFKDIIHVGQIKEMVDLNYWSKLTYEEKDFDSSGLVYNSSKAEYTEESILKTYQSQNIQGNVIKRVNALYERKSVLIFVPSVDEAITLAAQTPGSVAVYGDMDKDKRAEAIANFRSGKIRIIYNVNVLSVGFDHPGVDCIIMARSTASLSWYYQALGRGTRICEGKKDCLIVDFSGNLERFGPIESLYYKKENIWKLYGEGGRLLTGIPLHEYGEHVETDASKIIMTFGQHKGKEVKDVPPSYRAWALEKVTWNTYNEHIKAEMIRLKETQLA